MLTGVRIRDFRSIADSGWLPLGPISLVVGRNNSGKSSLLRALYLLQEGNRTQERDIRVDAGQARVDLRTASNFFYFKHARQRPQNIELEEGVLTAVYKGGVRLLTISEGNYQDVTKWPATEPGNLIYPIFSGRIQASYEQQVRREQAFSVIPDDANIVARVAALASSQVPEAEQFRSLCEAVLGVKLSVILGESGQQLGTPLDRYRQITLETMGTGITSALNLLVSLSGAKGKIFLVEEPENDLHPSALKALLDAITEASGENQFIITTHSSIVLGRLGALTGSVVLKAETSTDNGLPTTTYQVAEGAAERLDILRHLGYELADFDLGEGWLIFEESSAERIAREYLIPWFAPGLARLRTLAAAGTSRVRPIMEDFREIFLFAHLESVYRNRAWVLVDGDPSGKQVINDLKVKFKTWNEENFRNLNGHALEYYYPPVFQQKAEDALAVEDKKKKKEAKKQLLHEVLSWVDEDPQRAKQEFQASAAEFISHLQEIEEKVLSMDRI